MRFINRRNKLVTTALGTNSLITHDKKSPRIERKREGSLSEDPGAPWLKASVQGGFCRF